MECDLCHRGHDPQRLPFLCAVDARNRIYEGRMKNLQVTMENESLQAQINELLSGTGKPNMDTIDSARAGQSMAEERTEQIIAAADKLRDEIKAARDEVQARKKALARRRSDLASVSEGLAERRAKQQKDVEKSIQMRNYRWSQDAEDGSKTRSFLCSEAAGLYGLKRVRNGGSGEDEFRIGGVPITDLTNLNTQSPEEISTSLDHICHILMLASYYLSIRLPAEITLPHRDYPRPTIFNLLGSYQHGEIAFPNTPGVTPSSSEARVTDSQHVPRPRPLFIDKPLPQLFKDDPTTYNFFLEGVTLLAYDIAWLCSSQGISVGEGTSFEDICNIGQNLYNLLVDEPDRSLSQMTARIASKKPKVSDQDEDASLMGRFSHGTTYYSLAGAAGTDLVKTFKIAGPMKLRDKLKKKLLGDVSAAEWEMLEDDAWKVEEEPDKAVMVDGPEHKPGNAKPVEGKSSPRNASNGWMRVKNRS